MSYESERVQFRNTCGSEIILQDRASNYYTGRTIPNNQGMVLAQTWIYPKIGNSQGWKGNNRGAF